jgi:hypothetical protein
MIYRQLTPSNDYSFGQGRQNFLSGVEATRQAIFTRLRLYRGNFWRNTIAGLPMFQEILATSGSEANIAAIDALILKQISETETVQSVLEYSSTFDGKTRAYSFKAKVQAEDSTTIIQGLL